MYNAKSFLLVLFLILIMASVLQYVLSTAFDNETLSLDKRKQLELANRVFLNKSFYTYFWFRSPFFLAFVIFLRAFTELIF